MHRWAANEKIVKVTSEKAIDRINTLLQHELPAFLKQHLELLRDTHLTHRIINDILSAVYRLDSVRPSKRQQLYLEIADIHQSLSYQKSLLSLHNLDYLCDSHLSKIDLCSWCLDYLLAILTENWSSMTDAAAEIQSSGLFSEYQDILMVCSILCCLLGLKLFRNTSHWELRFKNIRMSLILSRKHCAFMLDEIVLLRYHFPL